MEEDDTAAVKPTGQMSPKLSRILALLMIELVSPDVMYNGIPWPEEEFMKVTIERCVSYGRYREVCIFCRYSRVMCSCRTDDKFMKVTIERCVFFYLYICIQKNSIKT